MGNLVSGAAAASGGGGKVVMADGSVRALSEPVSVAELMMDHPRHFVVDARVLKELGRRREQHNSHNQQQQQHPGGGAKVAPLPADHVLGAGGVYVLVPATRGKVSADEARRALSAARSLERSRSMPGFRRKLSPPSSKKKAGAEEPAQREATAAESTEDEEVEAARTDGFEGHRPEFLSRELSSRGWKPSLRTIEERVLPKKRSHWLF